MQRDGRNESIWQAFMPPYLPTNERHGATEFDVVIAGGGITGLTTALLLQTQGKKCLLAEAKTIGFGTTSGTTAHLNTLLESPYYQIEKDFGFNAASLLADFARNCISLIEKNVIQHDIDCDFKRQQAYLFAENDEQEKELEKIVSSFQKVGMSAAYTKDLPIPLAHTKAALFSHQGSIHATKYIYGLAKAFEQAGGIILHDCRVLNSSDQEGKKIVETTAGNFVCRSVVYATHIPLQINLLHFRCAPYRSYAMAVKLKGNSYPADLVYDMQDPYHYFRTQEVNGELFLIAGGEDHKTGHEPNTENRFRSLEAYLHTNFNIEKIMYRWSSQFFENTDGLPYIGVLPGTENAYVATGYSGNGITLGSGAAMVISDLILRGSNEYRDLFDPARVSPVAGFSNFVKENADVVKELVAGRMNLSEMESLSSLAHGEAKVVNYHGDTVGLYKDERGGLHAVSPVCTHAKCTVSWNNSEQSWDCPCHGARYNAAGEIITAPAHRNLQQIDIIDKEEKS